MFTKQNFREMFYLQDTFNKTVNPEWRTANYAWLDAILVESVEAMEYDGWKWWKKQVRNESQLHMELVDIWHFAMSYMMTAKTEKIESVVELMWGELESTKPLDEKFKVILKQFIYETVIGKFELSTFNSLMFSCGLSWMNLYKLYISKNALNHFRQTHGYKDGSYKKIWNGKEDNEVVSEILSSVNNISFGELLIKLEKLYAN